MLDVKQVGLDDVTIIATDGVGLGVDPISNRIGSGDEYTSRVVTLLHPEAILSPEGTSHAEQHRLAPRRFASLDGVRLGLLGNSKLNADAVLLAIGDLLQERYAIESVTVRSKPTFSKPAPDDIVAELISNSDVIVTGVGD